MRRLMTAMIFMLTVAAPVEAEDLWCVHREPELQEAKINVKQKLADLDRSWIRLSSKKVGVFVTCRCVDEPVMILYSYRICSADLARSVEAEVSALVRRGGNHVCARGCPKKLEVDLITQKD